MSPGASTSRRRVGREAPQDLERQPRLQREVVLAAVAPAPAPEALQQEHVVRIEVRARRRRPARRSSPSGRRGARYGRNAKRRSSASAARSTQVDALHQQRPVARRQRPEVGARGTDRARATSARLRARRAAIRRRRAPRARRAPARVNRPAKSGHRAADEQRSFCQWRREECGRRRVPPSGARAAQRARRTGRAHSRRPSADYSEAEATGCATMPAAGGRADAPARCAASGRAPAPFAHAHGSPMNIFANTVVTLTFELFDADGALLEATDEPITYLHGGHSGHAAQARGGAQP